MSTPATYAVRVVNFSQFKMETHVQKVLQKAWALSVGRPLTAGGLLKAAVLEARTHRSKALVMLASLLPIPGQKVVRAVVSPADLAALPVTSPLADSYSVAEGFFKDTGEVWGRDLVTLALLAKDDGSLQEIASEAGATIETVRNEWFNFVASSGQRRTRDAWQRWYRAAGVPLPAEEKTASAPGYLFTWNPRQRGFAEIEKHIEEIEKQGFSVFSWGVGNRRSISQNARVFLLRQGSEPRGLVAVGEVKGDIKEETHWNKLRASEDQKVAVVDIRWTALSREPFLGLPQLVQHTSDSSIWSSQASGIELPADLAEKLEEIWPRAWAEHIHSVQGLPNIEARQWIASFNADRGKNDDSLKLERYINAFARVMASRNLKPPLSIGLFGDWGSGKSFFMDQLYDKIELLSARETVDGEAPLYWQKICQIRFNAWHYAETNLWASLVSTIFNELRFFLDGRTEDADEFNKLLKELEVAGELRKEAEQKVEQAAKLHQAARTNVAEAEKQLGEVKPAKLSDEQLQLILKKNITEVVKGVEQDTIIRLLESAAQWTGRQEFKEGADRIKSGEQTVAAAAALLDEARSLSSHAGFWWRVLSGSRLYRTRGFWITIGALAPIPLTLLLLWRWKPELQQGWANLWGLIGELLALTSAILAWIRSHLGGATKVFDRLSSLQANVARSIEEARNRDRTAYETERDKALADEKRAQDHLERMHNEEQQAAEAERKARDALRDSTSQARLGRFIRERASSADYEKHLGLIAMIHRDFERLSELMQKAQEKSTAVAPEPKTKDSVVQSPGAAPQPNAEALPRIDRIILYIDDLDRCYPPEKVVKILEAVHLLLFFPLFVVVVGVDSRWVSRSLHKHYEGMLADEAISPDQEKHKNERAPAESQDFLEKIFQVPFWLRRMEPAAVQRLIHSLISSDEVEAAPAAPLPLAAPGGAATAPGPDDSEGDRKLETSVPTTVADSPQRAAARQTTSEAESDPLISGETLEAPSESLRITEAELSFMDKVAPLMPRTPRSVKRFVNIYRLYKAALAPVALAKFLGTPAKPGNFRSVQILLALVTGTPRLAQKVFEALQEVGEAASAKRLSDLVNIGASEETWQTTLQALREFAHEDNDLPLGALREVAPLVARYSVHHMVSAAPGEAGLG